MRALIPPCLSCRRLFSSTSVRSGKRPQEPYDMPRPRIDVYGRPVISRPSDRRVSEDAQDDPAWRKLVSCADGPESVLESELALMAEPSKKGFYETYGAYDGYGLRNKARYRVIDGKVEEWNGAGAGWMSALGFKRPFFRPGQRIEVPGFRHRSSRMVFGSQPSRQKKIGDGKLGFERFSRSAPPHISGGRQYSTMSETETRRRAAAGKGLGRICEINAKLIADRPWQPTKKLTFTAMAGLRELHRSDPEQFNRQYLARKFGISFEAVGRILRSNWRDKAAKKQDSVRRSAASPATLAAPELTDIRGTKWDRDPSTSSSSPAQTIARMNRRM